MTTCRICGMTYIPSEPEDKKLHAEEHKKLASGIQPLKVREFSKTFGWAIAHNGDRLEVLKDKYDPDMGKLVVAYSWWSRALANGVSVKDFDAYMDAHLAFADSLVSGEGGAEAQSSIRKWERYSG